MRLLSRLLAFFAVAALAVALAACGGGDEISEVTCGELGLAGAGSDQQQNEEKLDELEREIADEVGGSEEEKTANEVKASGAIIGACVREKDPNYKPGDEAVEYIENNP